MAVTSKQPNLVYTGRYIRKSKHTEINLYDGKRDISMGKFRNSNFEKKQPNCRLFLTILLTDKNYFYGSIITASACKRKLWCNIDELETIQIPNYRITIYRMINTDFPFSSCFQIVYDQIL